jgi:glycosyltransferase involved in cell wall biosynthesis
MKIILFIRSLELGGAERQLINLATQLSNNHEVVVLTFYDHNEYTFSEWPPIKYRLITLAKKGRWHIFGFIFNFLKIIRRNKPDIIYSFMSTASIVALLSPVVWSKIAVVWGIRSSNMKTTLYGKLPLLFRWLECRLSSYANLIIANSEAGRKEAFCEGFKNRNIVVIPNGIDSSEFKRCDILRYEIRKKLNIPYDSLVIGAVARHDPMKGLEIFLEAAAIYKKSFPKSYFMIIGSGIENYTELLKLKARSHGLQDSMMWIPKTNKVAPYYSAMDIFTSASIYGEGFSNVIAEAMLSQLPIVVTDVGDTRKFTGDCGIVVSPDSPQSIAVAWEYFHNLSEPELQAIGIRSRNHILNNYSINSMVKLTESALIAAVSAIRKKYN